MVEDVGVRGHLGWEGGGVANVQGYCVIEEG